MRHLYYTNLVRWANKPIRNCSFRNLWIVNTLATFANIATPATRPRPPQVSLLLDKYPGGWLTQNRPEPPEKAPAR